MFFKHKYITTPIVTPADIITASSHNLADALNNNIKSQSKGAKNIADLKRLQHILSGSNTFINNDTDASTPRVTPQPDTPPPRVRDTVALPRVPKISTNKAERPTEHPASSPTIQTRNNRATNQPTSPPEMNTRSRRAQKITQDTMLRMINIQGNNIIPKQAAI